MVSAAEEQPEPSLESAETASLRGAGDKSASAAGKGAARFIAKRIALAVSLVVLLLIGTISVFQWQHRDKPTSDPYSMAYSLLKSNQPEQAQQCFEQIPEHDARRYEGLAAVLFEQGDLDKARAMSAQCLEKDPENVYANVINGAILFSEGKLAEAGSLYQQAAQKKHGTSWQRAEALSGLGRIYSAQGDSEKSLTCYSQAATLNPESSIILTNHGTALEKKGNLAEAAALYQKASSINPQDAIALSMLADIQKKQKIAEDQSHNERIDRLIKELADARKRAPAPHPPEEQWTSKPVTMSFVNFQHRGSLSLREGEDEFFIVRLNSLLQENGRVQVLERDLLDKLLEELKLSATDLVDQKKALEVGKLLAARIIATGSILRSGKDLQTSIRLTETETTLLKAAVTETDTDVSRLADKTAQQVLNKIKQAYPIRGYITAVTSGQVQLNIGSETGVHPGMQLKVLPDPVPADKKQLSPHSLNAPAIRITSVDTKTSTAQVVEPGQVITKRMRVEEIVQ
jgi:tetratricopeptide (TPR) repeat protein